MEDSDGVFYYCARDAKPPTPKSGHSLVSLETWMEFSDGRCVDEFGTCDIFRPKGEQR